ncbi:MFS transporter [Pleomorphomonas carboxyditropha]|uniref:MFS transporter n=1 Tax=Pleomorphomonas carboxyditropha TaxID=2023338 RepID=A0A2G9WVM7_9HYPH|nr:MFS transporter [Pleomorphomonas carboxyditropha]PIO98180.1 MFS transporter [Pleomorphomonas carboxyditropha]
MSIAAKPFPFSAATIAEFALAIGSFAIGTGEFAAMGFLPDVASAWQVTMPEAGRIISAYALGVVVGAPLIAVVGARLSRLRLLLVLMGLFAAGNLASAMAPSFTGLVVLRFITALPHGAYFGVAALVAAGMAPPDGRARAIGRVMLGLTVATLVGTPVATWAGQTLGWRTAFGVVGSLGLLTVALVFVCVPRDQPRPGASPLRELGALREPQVWLTLAIGATGFGGMFAVFSYITPTLIEVSGIPQGGVPFVLCVFGAGMIAGNIVGPKLADRALLPTIAGLLAWNVVVLALFTVAARHPATSVVGVFLIGTGFAVVPTLQTRLMDVGKDAQTLAAALNHSAFNIANALGAWLGGVAIAAGFGWTSTGWVGVLLGLVGSCMFVISLLLDRKGRTGDDDMRPCQPTV